MNTYMITLPSQMFSCCPVSWQSKSFTLNYAIIPKESITVMLMVWPPCTPDFLWNISLWGRDRGQCSYLAWLIDGMGGRASLRPKDGFLGTYMHFFFL